MEFRSTLLFSLILLSVSVLVISDDVQKCQYVVRVKTGNVESAGTDSKISVTIGTKTGETFFICDLVGWGGDPSVDYFEKNNLDVFIGFGNCLSSSPCSLILVSDGSGNKPGWYVDYVEVIYISLDGHCQQQKFEIDRWLAVDEPPYCLIAEKNLCESTTTSTMITTGTLARLVSRVLAV